MNQHMSSRAATALAALTIAACSSGAGPRDAARVDRVHESVVSLDGALARNVGSLTFADGEGPAYVSQDGLDAPPLDDSTTGKACAANAECDLSGRKVTVCSSSLTGDPIDPTPTCIGSCAPGDPTRVNLCDGNTGVCVQNSATTGICLGFCEFGATEAPPTKACAGKNACNVYGTGRDPMTMSAIGIGICQGGCAVDADCTKGTCAPELGVCVSTPFAFTKAVGDACETADRIDFATKKGNCNCLLNRTSGKGYCTSACIVGSATNTCDDGFTCDPGLPAEDAAGTPLFTGVSVGLAGRCFKNCVTDADCTAVNGYCGNASDSATTSRPSATGQTVCIPGTKPAM